MAAPSGDDPAGFPECAGLTTIRRSCARRSRRCLGCSLGESRPILRHFNVSRCPRGIPEVARRAPAVTPCEEIAERLTVTTTRPCQIGETTTSRMRSDNGDDDCMTAKKERKAHDDYIIIITIIIIIIRLFLSQCSFSKFVSNCAELTCSGAHCLTQCPQRFVSFVCPFFKLRLREEVGGAGCPLRVTSGAAPPCAIFSHVTNAASSLHPRRCRHPRVVPPVSLRQDLALS